MLRTWFSARLDVEVKTRIHREKEVTSLLTHPRHTGVV